MSRIGGNPDWGHKIGKRFQAGKSGNPGGRNDISAIKALARDKADAALDTLVQIAGDKAAPAAARVAAATAILDRGYGKPAQMVTATVSVLDRLSHEDRIVMEGLLSAMVPEAEAPTLQ